MQSYPDQFRGGPSEMPLEPAPDLPGQIGCSRNYLVKRRHFLIEKAVVHRLHDFLVENLSQIAEIHDHTRNWVDFAFYAHFQNVVVAMAVRMRFFPEQLPVFLIAQRIHPANMRCGKLGFSGDYHLLFCFTLLDAGRGPHDARLCLNCVSCAAM